MSSVWRYPRNVLAFGAASFSQPSPSETSIAFQAGSAAMRGTSPDAWSYTPAANDSAGAVPRGDPTRLKAPLPKKAGMRYVGSVVARTNVVSWADAERTRRKRSEPATGRTRSPMAGSPNFTRRSPRWPRLESVPHRHQQCPRQDRTREEQVARQPAHEAQARVTLFQTDRLVGVQQAGPNRDATRGKDILRAEVEIAVCGQLVRTTDCGRAPPVHEVPIGIEA